MAIEVFNRQELKFIITANQYTAITAALLPYMRLDKHNKEGRSYRLYNLYIDTPDHALIRNSLTKPVYKEKLRLRSYTAFQADEHVFLEVKKRYKRITNKRRTKLTLRDALAFIEYGRYTGSDDGTNKQVIREFEAILSASHYVPKTFITYDRMAYQSNDALLDLRVTFDTNLTVRRYGQEKSESLLRDGRIIMELKSIHNIPLWLVAVLNEEGVHKQSFSKYGQEYLHYLRRDATITEGVARA